MQYDVNLSAYGIQRFEVIGKFFKYVGAGKIRVTTNRGGSIELANGQGVWGEDFTSLSVQERLGVETRGVLLAGSYDFRDDTVSGKVEVLNEILQTSGNVVMLQKGWNSSAVLPGEVIIVTAAQNANGLVINKMMAERATTAANGTQYIARKGAEYLFLANVTYGTNGNDWMFTDNTQYHVPKGFEIVVQPVGGANPALFRSVAYTLKP